MEKVFYSNGKLLLTAEYLVLDGAKALALPTRFGQDLEVAEGSGRLIRWQSFDSDGSRWFETTLPFDAIAEKHTFEDTAKNTLVKILHEALQLNPDFLNADGYGIATKLTFPRLWGLGTSSTLINNIAQWLRIDAHTLLQNSFGGSGYDIACAQHDSPITYRLNAGKPIVKEVDFDPDFKKHLYFVYLNHKQSSKSAIETYRKNQFDKAKAILEINLLTEAILEATDLHSFSLFLENHEAIMSGILKTETIKERLFTDFKGTVKSLGAWGGDFVLAVAEENPIHYFQSNGFDTVIKYSDIIL